jgi:replicative DNA helicase
VTCPTGEAALVGLVLETGDGSQLDRVRPGDFASTVHGEIWTLCWELHSRCVPVNPATVMRHALKRFPAHQVELIERAVLAVFPNNLVPAAGDYLATAVLEDAARRRLAGAGQRLVAYAESNLDLRELLDKMRSDYRAVADAINRALGEQPVTEVRAA